MADVARGKALVAKLRADPSVRDFQALAVWCGRYKNVRQKIKAVEPTTVALRSLAGMLDLPPDKREKKLTELIKVGSPAQKGLAKQAKANPQLMKTVLNREMKAREKAAKLAALKGGNKGEAAKVAKAADKTAKGSPTKGLPDITAGTDKQNAFAKDIRGRLIKTLQGMVDELKRAQAGRYDDLTVDKWLDSGADGTPELKKALANSDPKFWIDKVRGDERSRAGLQNLVAKLKRS